MRAADTIAAIATAHGRAGIGVVRVSGPEVPALMRAMLGVALHPRRAELSDFLDATGAAIDRGIALYFPAPHSYTGEHVLELQGHGGAAILRLLLARCFELGARPAEPGEFTRRAFLNGKLDLAQAESVADLIDASSVAAARSAMRSLAGEFSARVNVLRDALIDLRALVEASLDFPDEEVDFLEKSRARERVQRLREDTNALYRTAMRGNLLREGARVVLLGRPNVGKSSLMNVLAGEEVAIVTEIAGTTRDALRRELVIEGVPIHIVDTAGLRATGDAVERIGVERAWREIGQADIALHVVDSLDADLDVEPEIISGIPRTAKKLRIINKIDILGVTACRTPCDDGEEVFVSAKTGEGIELLRSALLDAVGWKETEETPFIARERHLAALRASMAALERASGCLAQQELFAEELRQAQQALSAITGEVTADDLLGEIFSRFCIGK
ncbi:MAG: tRNA uridine-5-carboxymethylaminomethyl(34) synthesis GTPase MnmE [Burkholderiales bacterium]